MKHDSMNLTAPHTARELAQADTEAGAMHAKQIATMIAEDAYLDRDDIGKPIAGQPVTLIYRNWRGEVAERTIIPGKVWFGSTDWHPEPQWLLTAFDVEKGADRDFALKDFGQPAAEKLGEWDALEEFKERAEFARKAYQHVCGDIAGRVPTVGKHQAVNHEHLRRIYVEAKDAFPQFADTLAWMLWHEIVRFDRLVILTEDFTISTPAQIGGAA